LRPFKIVSLAAAALTAVAASACVQEPEVNLLRGINLAGAEFGHEKPGFSAAARGQFGKDWTYNGESTIAYFARHGIRLIRLPFRWERIQPELGCDLDAAELKRLRRFVDLARSYECRVILDVHNYGRYALPVAGGSSREFIIDERSGDRAPVSREHFADLWSRLAQEFRDHAALHGYGLMNEPHDMGGSDWKAISQHAVEAIRRQDARTAIYVAGLEWSKSYRWTVANGPDAWIRDPAGNIVYEAHCYFDEDGSGRYQISFEEEARRDPRILDRAVDRLEDFAQWCRRNQVRGFLGEYGVPRDEPRWHELFSRFLMRLDELGMESTCWAAGEWWGDYPLSVQPGHAFVSDSPLLIRLKRRTR